MPNHNMPVVTRSDKKVSYEQRDMSVAYKLKNDLIQLFNDLENDEGNIRENFNKTNDKLETILGDNLNLYWITFVAMGYIIFDLGCLITKRIIVKTYESMFHPLNYLNFWNNKKEEAKNNEPDKDEK